MGTSSSGLLKISRSGSTITAHYNEGSGWVSVASFPDTFASEATVQVGAYTGDDGTFHVASDGIYYKVINQPPEIDSFEVERDCSAGLLSVKFTCSAHDPDGEIFGYTVDYSDGSTPETNDTGIFYYTYTDQNTYNITCTVVDDDGATSTSEPTSYGENETHTGLIDVPIDSDRDALSDCWEFYGYDHNDDGIIDVDLPAMGADPTKKDVFVEIDYTYDDERKDEDKPKLEAIRKIVTAFKEQGINLHVDGGPSFPFMDPENPLKLWGLLSKANPIKYPGVELVKQITGNMMDHGKFYELISDHFSLERRPVFHYCIFSHQAVLVDSDDDGNIDDYVSGYTLPWGGYFIVSLNDHILTDQAGTFMHELGHSLGLHHGGPIGKPSAVENNKPNYLSVMNYSFQFDGLTIDGKKYNFDYSRFNLPPLKECEPGLDESIGLNGGSEPIYNYYTIYYCEANGSKQDVDYDPNHPIDWNCNGNYLEDEVITDINQDGYKTILDSYNDWENLDFKRGGTGAFGAIQLPPDIIPIEDAIIEEITEEQIENKKHDYAVSLDISATEIVCPDATYTHTFTLENTGENPDTYSLSANSSMGWSNLGSLPYAVSLNPDEKMVFAIPIHVPLSASSDDEERFNILATSQANDNLADSAEIVVKVLVDVEPPDTSLTANPDNLWPPNHKMKPVTVTADVSDNCDPDPLCLITEVTSNEPINGTGDGDTEPDWEITRDLTVNLRAERAGTGTGRKYTITVECTDASGNIATADTFVTVPHDQQ